MITLIIRSYLAGPLRYIIRSYLDGLLSEQATLSAGNLLEHYIFHHNVSYFSKFGPNSSALCWPNFQSKLGILPGLHYELRIACFGIFIMISHYCTCLRVCFNKYSFSKNVVAYMIRRKCV